MSCVDKMEWLDTEKRRKKAKEMGLDFLVDPWGNAFVQRKKGALL